MSSRRFLVLALALVVTVVGWALFRPERLWINQSVHEAAALAGDARAVTIARGAFRSVHHDTRGTATVYRGADGRTVVRFTDFATSNGPDVHVYLVNAGDANDDATVARAGFVDLGSIKGNVGDQNYALPSGFDAARPFAVTVWCKRFGVNFGTAAVRPVS